METFFIRLSRGSGLHGLSSMKEISKIGNFHLVRQLLDVKKIKLIKITNNIFGKFYKDPSNNNTQYLRTRIRKFKKTLEKTGINYDQIFQSIKNLASSRDTLDSYLSKIDEELIVKKKTKIWINLKKFNNLNEEMKMRVLNKSIKEFTKAYYSPRSKKTINLVKNLKVTKNVKFTLGGCFILKQKNHIIIEKEKKN